MNGDTLFISVLGTNDYLPCRYYLPGEKDRATKPVRFVQEAVLGLMPVDQRPDRGIVLVTDLARTRNWEDDGHRDREGNILPRQGLAQRLRSLDMDVQSVCIPDGRNEEEIWEIFRIITSQIPEKARLVVDITHSFRSLSMVLLAAIRYAKAVKDAQVQAVQYGAMEALGDYNTVKAMPEQDRLVPVFDLTPFDAILDWSEAASSFLDSGSPTELVHLSREQIKPILVATRGQDSQANAIRGFVNSLEKFCAHVSANRGPEIPGLAQATRQHLARAKESELLPALVPLFDRIEEDLAGFAGDSLDIALQTARWCLAHSFLPQGYTALQEGILTWCLERHGVDDPIRLSLREAASSAFAIFNQKIPRARWNANASEHESLILTIQGMAGFKELAPHMDRLTQVRNNINHGGYNQDRPDPERLRRALMELIEAISTWKEQHPA